MKISFYLIYLAGIATFCLPVQSSAQRLAVLIPEKTPLTEKFVESLRYSLSSGVILLDDSLGETAFKSVTVENAFNMTAGESKRIASVIGCDYFLIVRTGALRRSSFEKPEYYEAFSISYLVSGRTGRLVFWDLESFEADNAVESEKLFLRSAAELSANIAAIAQAANKKEISERPQTQIEEVPETTAETRNFRPPLPYKRVQPKYTRIANLYDALGTVDISVDIDDKGSIMRTEIVRWAGYGLDEAVDEAVRKMNWRPAERGGKALPMRVLLRYNFTRIEKE